MDRGGGNHLSRMFPVATVCWRDSREAGGVAAAGMASVRLASHSSRPGLPGPWTMSGLCSIGSCCPYCPYSAEPMPKGKAPPGPSSAKDIASSVLHRLHCPKVIGGTMLYKSRQRFSSGGLRSRTCDSPAECVAPLLDHLWNALADLVHRQGDHLLRVERWLIRPWRHVGADRFAAIPGDHL